MKYAVIQSAINEPFFKPAETLRLLHRVNSKGEAKSINTFQSESRKLFRN